MNKDVQEKSITATFGAETKTNAGFRYHEDFGGINVYGNVESVQKAIFLLQSLSKEDIDKLRGQVETSTPKLTGDKVEINAETIIQRNLGGLSLHLTDSLPTNINLVEREELKRQIKDEIAESGSKTEKRIDKLGSDLTDLSTTSP